MIAPTLHVCVPVHNRAAITERFAQSLADQCSSLRVHLLLLDDGSTDGTAERAAARYPDLTVLRGDGTWWFGGAMHEAWRWLSVHAEDDDAVLLVNDDCVLPPDFVARGCAWLERHPRALVQAQNWSLDGQRLVDSGTRARFLAFDFVPAGSAAEINCLSTRGLFLRWKTWRCLGGWFPRVLPHYGSDFEFTLRAGRRGYPLLCPDDLRLRFDESTTGHAELRADDLHGLWSRWSSRRNPRHPAYQSALVLLAFPWYALPTALARVWASGAWNLISAGARVARRRVR